MDAATRTRLLGADPVEWLLASGEPGSCWLTLTGALGRPAHDPDMMAAHTAVLADPGIRGLLAKVPDWEADNEISGHDRPLYAPNLLGLLADMGVTAADDACLDRPLDSMLSHQDEDGCFQSFGRLRSARLGWHSLLCDNHAIVEQLLRFGRGEDPRVLWALERMEVDLADLAQGRAWPCLGDSAWGFRGPGRKGGLLSHGHASGVAGVFVPAPDRAAGLAGRCGSGVAQSLDRAGNRETVHVRTRQTVQAGKVARHLVQLAGGARRCRPVSAVVDVLGLHRGRPGWAARAHRRTSGARAVGSRQARYAEASNPW